MDIWRDFHGPNAAYVLELYDRYCQNPGAVDAATRAFFAQWAPPVEIAALPSAPQPQVAVDKIVGAANLAQAIRAFGHLAAQLDPLGSQPPGDPSLDAASHGLTEDDLRRLPGSLIGGPLAERAASAFEAIQSLRAVYSSTSGYDFGHIPIPEERDWLRQAVEAGQFRPPQDPINPQALLERLTQVEVFERFLQRAF